MRPRIIFTVNAAGQLYPTTTFPVKVLTKVAYFIRIYTPLDLTDDNMLEVSFI